MDFIQIDVGNKDKFNFLFLINFLFLYPFKVFNMNFKYIIHLLIGIPFLLTNCQNQTDNTALGQTKSESKELGSQALIEQVESQVMAFHAADTSLNAQGVVDLLWPEFTMLADGNHVKYEEVKIGSKAFMESLEAFHTEWNDLKIIPLGENHAISSFTFTDSLVAKNGTITQNRGPNTFVWEKRNEEWKVIYGDADHYPIHQNP